MHEDCHAPQNDLLFQERVQYSLADIKFWHKTFCTEKLMLNFQCSAPAHCWCNSLSWAQHGFAKTKKRSKKRIIGHCWFCKLWEETYLWKHYKIHTESIIFHNFFMFLTNPFFLTNFFYALTNQKGFAKVMKVSYLCDTFMQFLKIDTAFEFDCFVCRRQIWWSIGFWWPRVGCDLN